MAEWKYLYIPLTRLPLIPLFYLLLILQINLESSGNPRNRGKLVRLRMQHNVSAAHLNDMFRLTGDHISEQNP